MVFRERISTQDMGPTGVVAESTASIYSTLSKEGRQAIIDDIMNGTFYRKGDPKEYLNGRKFSLEQAKKLFGYMLSGQAGDLFEALLVDGQDAQDDKLPARYR